MSVGNEFLVHICRCREILKQNTNKQIFKTIAHNNQLYGKGTSNHHIHHSNSNKHNLGQEKKKNIFYAIVIGVKFHNCQNSAIISQQTI